jgi:hypothetical protein
MYMDTTEISLMQQYYLTMACVGIVSLGIIYLLVTQRGDGG